jgi:hypothetical protein
MDERRRRIFSFGLPLIGLLITVPEMLRLFEAQRVAEACLRGAQDPGSCPAGPDPVFFAIAAVFGLLFLARLGFLAWEYWRSER